MFMLSGSSLVSSHSGVKIVFYWEINEKKIDKEKLVIKQLLWSLSTNQRPVSRSRNQSQPIRGHWLKWVWEQESELWTCIELVKWPKCCTFVKEIVFVSRAGTISLKQKFSIVTERLVSILISILHHSKWASSYRVLPEAWHEFATE